MKKLNRKGFTLIELLAVIVIMAIIVVVTVPTIINTIADARVNSIWNLAKATANSYNNIVAQDMLATNPVLSEIELGKYWKCIGDTSNRGGLEVDLVSILDLPITDLNLGDIDGGKYDDDTDINFPGNLLEPPIDYLTENTCSLIRLNDDGNVEIFLVAKKGGKFDVAGKVVYAFSSSDKGGTK